MSKELNIIEAINMPVGTILKDGDLDTSNVLKVCCDESDGSKYFKVERDGIWIELNRLDNLWLNGKYVIYKKPVSFIEAIESKKNVRVDIEHLNAYDENFKSKLNVYSPISCIFSLLGNSLTSCSVREIIKEGKWYIQED